MYYCNNLCQKLDWKKHKHECSLYRQHFHILNANIDRFLLRLYLFIDNNPQVAEQKFAVTWTDEGKFRSFNDLMSHQKDIEDDVMRSQMFSAICRRYIKCNLDCNIGSLFELFCKICINSYSIMNTDLNEIGSALFVLESALDHSCAPNAAPIFNGIDMEIRAMNDIAKNEPITINYLDLKEPKALRCQMLSEQYYFDCRCPRCSTDFDKGKQVELTCF